MLNGTEEIDPDIYIKAAELIDDNERKQSCTAIAQIATGSHFNHMCTEAKIYSEIFAPHSDSICGDWLHECFSDNPESLLSKDANEWRLTALCLASAMAGTGDLYIRPEEESA